MKTSLIFASLLAAAMFTQVVSAQDKPIQIAQMDMKMGMPAKPMPMEAKPEMDADKQMPATQANMAKMQQQMDKIVATTDPKERQKLLQEHMETMQANMKAMRGMSGPAMKGKSASGGAHQGGSTKPVDMQKRQEMTETRMDMMQMMMEQMMQREQAMKPMPHM